MDKTMTDKLMYIAKDDTLNTHSVDYNYWLKRLDIKLIKPTNKH